MESAIITNPYYELNAIHDPEKFYGRSNLLGKFFEALAHHQSISIVGLHKIGKSSLLYCACRKEMRRRFQADLSRHIFVHLDLREYLGKTIPDFFHDVCKEILIEGQKIHGLVLHSEGQGADEFSNILDQIADQGYYPVLLLDSFDNITRNSNFGPDFLSFLRAQVSKGRVSYVTATYAPLSELSHKGIIDSPFFNIFYQYTLGPLTNEEALELITVPAQQAHMPFTEEEGAFVRHYAGLHPFFIQRVCYVLFEEKRQPANGNADFEKYVRTQAYRELLPHFTDMWKRLYEKDRLLLEAEAQQKNKSERALPELSESAFFRQFVRNILQVRLFELSEKELEDALDKMNDLAELGETRLQLLKAVAQRLDDDNSPSAIEKGKAIREVLCEAHERMRGTGIQSDTAPDWKLYNVLFYRFFRYHLMNNVISGRLGFTSDRQYYRDRKKAIQILRNILLEME